MRLGLILGAAYTWIALMCSDYMDSARKSRTQPPYPPWLKVTAYLLVLAVFVIWL